MTKEQKEKEYTCAAHIRTRGYERCCSCDGDRKCDQAKEEK